MCNTCYHKLGRNKKAWKCPHPNLLLYAKGKCKNCYLSIYHKETSFKNDKIEDNIKVEENKINIENNKSLINNN